MKILYIGSSSALSFVPFKALLSSGYHIVAVGMDNPVVFQQKIIALENESLSLAASEHEIPLINLALPVAEVIRQCRGYAVDIILMACYGKRLPVTFMDFPALGCFNLHPSLLPVFRGPEPVFWQMKAAAKTGVSWHKVVHDFDAGDIVAQQAVSLDDGMDYQQINLLLGKAGAEQILSFLPGMNDALQPVVKQSTELASYYPYPQQQDFVVERQWSARHAYNFMCATDKFGQLYHCQYGSYSYLLGQAIAYEEQADVEEIRVNNGKVIIPCKQSVLIATYAGKIQLL